MKREYRVCNTCIFGVTLKINDQYGQLGCLNHKRNLTRGAFQVVRSEFSCDFWKKDGEREGWHRRWELYHPYEHPFDLSERYRVQRIEAYMWVKTKMVPEEEKVKYQQWVDRGKPNNE